MERDVISVGLADDEPLFTAGLALIVDSQDDMRVAWRAIDGDDVVTCHSREPVDVILMDVQMPKTNGIEATRRLVVSGADARIVVLTTFDTNEYVMTAIDAGASGFLVKNTPPERLLDAIRVVHRGDSVISPGPTRRLFSAYRSRPVSTHVAVSSPETEGAARLTSREYDVLRLIARGFTNREICDRLWLSMPTVKTHVGNLLAKTHARDRVQLVLFAIREGVVDVTDVLAP